MNATIQTMHNPARGSAFRWIASSSVMEAIVAIAVMALSIVGLAGVNPLLMAAIAAIVAGAAVLLEGRVLEKTASAVSGRGNAISSLNAEVLGAVAGIILGILALMNVASLTLLSVAVLVFGVTFLLSALSSSSEAAKVGSFSDGFLLLGLSVSVLGLLAVIGISPATLVLVGLLLLGAASIFGGTIRGFRTIHQSRSEPVG